MVFHLVARDGYDLTLWAEDWSEHAHVIVVSDLGFVNILTAPMWTGAKSDSTLILDVRFELI